MRDKRGQLSILAVITASAAPLIAGILNARVSVAFHQRFVRAQSRMSDRTSMAFGAAESKTSTSRKRLSPKILETLDPCVILVKELVGRYSHLWETKGGIFSLAQGVVYWEPPQSCQQVLLEELTRSGNLLHTYGPEQGLPELTESLTEKISIENGLVNHHLMVTMGANQAYVNCVLTCLGDGSKAVVFSPYYFNHVMAIQMCCGNDSVVVGPSTDQGIPDLEWLQQTLEHQAIDMVTIVNPGNPTGVSLSKQVLQRAVDLCEKHSAWLVLDCTYEYFTSNPSHQPIASFPDSPHVIHIYSFSKSYALAGYRCGYVCFSKEDNDALLANMLKVQDTIPIGPARISQLAAWGALQAGKEWVRERYATLEGSRQAIIDSLQPLKIMGGSGAMYVMAQLPKTNHEQGQDDVEVCRRLVEEYGIAVIPGTYCGFPGWIRVCYANLAPEKSLLAAERLRNGVRAIVFHEDPLGAP